MEFSNSAQDLNKARGSSATPFCLVFITDRRPHSTIHRHGPSLSGCRCSHLEQFTSARHFCTSLLVFQSRLKTHLFAISRPSPWPCTVLAQLHLSFRTLNCSCY